MITFIPTAVNIEEWDNWFINRYQAIIYTSKLTSAEDKNPQMTMQEYDKLIFYDHITKEYRLIKKHPILYKLMRLKRYPMTKR